jgi:hypothetical protein
MRRTSVGRKWPLNRPFARVEKTGNRAGAASVARIYATDATSTAYGPAASQLRISMSFLSISAAAVCQTENLDGRMGDVHHSVLLLSPAFLDRLVDERRLPAM